MLQTKILRKNAYMRLSKAKGSSFCREPQKRFLLSYFDSFSPPNLNRSAMKALLRVTLVSLALRFCTLF